MVKDDPNQIANFSLKEITMIVAVVSISITMIAATALIVIVAHNIDWADPDNQVVGLELMRQVGVMFAAIGHSSILLIGLGAGGATMAAGVALANKVKSKDMNN